MGRKGSKNSSDKRRIKKKTGKEKKTKTPTTDQTPLKSIQEGGEKNERSEVGVSKLPEEPVVIKEEIVDPYTQNILDWVASVKPFEEEEDLISTHSEENAGGEKKNDCSESGVSELPKDPGVKKQGVVDHQTKNVLDWVTSIESLDEEEKDLISSDDLIICTEDEPERESGTAQSVKVPDESVVVTTIAKTPTVLPDQQMNASEEQDSFEVEGTKEENKNSDGHTSRRPKTKMKRHPEQEMVQKIDDFPKIDIPSKEPGYSYPQTPLTPSMSDDEETANPVSPAVICLDDEPEIICIEDESDVESGAAQGVEVHSENVVVTTPAKTSTVIPDQQIDDSKEQDFFEVEGECIIRMAGEDTVLKKADILPFVGNIGFIGCGPMAEAFIACLIYSGHTVYGYNRTTEKWTDVPRKPAIVLTPAALLEKCDIVFCCVRDSAAVKNIMEMPGGVLEFMEDHPGKAYVEMSSVDPDTISLYSEKVNSKGGSYLNAQIGRTRPAAYMGCSFIKASGHQETFVKCRPCFASFSSYAVFMSSNVIEASIVSISEHVIEALSVITLSDTLLAASKMGVSQHALYNGLVATHSRSEIIGVAAQNMLGDLQDVFIPLKHVIKNLRMAYKLKKSELRNEYLLNGLNLCNEVLNQYPEAAEHDVSCLYKLRTPEFVRPIAKT